MSKMIFGYGSTLKACLNIDANPPVFAIVFRDTGQENPIGPTTMEESEAKYGPMDVINEETDVVFFFADEAQRDRVFDSFNA